MGAGHPSGLTREQALALAEQELADGNPESPQSFRVSAALPESQRAALRIRSTREAIIAASKLGIEDEEDAEERECDSCGVQLLPGSHFCHKCGAAQRARGWSEAPRLSLAEFLAEEPEPETPPGEAATASASAPEETAMLDGAATPTAVVTDDDTAPQAQAVAMDADSEDEDRGEFAHGQPVSWSMSLPDAAEEDQARRSSLEARYDALEALAKASGSSEAAASGAREIAPMAEVYDLDAGNSDDEIVADEVQETRRRSGRFSLTRHYEALDCGPALAAVATASEHSITGRTSGASEAEATELTSPPHAQPDCGDEGQAEQPSDGPETGSHARCAR